MTDSAGPAASEGREEGRGTRRAWVLGALAVGALSIGSHLYDAARWPVLTAIGIEKWRVECTGRDRVYRLESDHPLGGASSMQSILRRGLAVLDAEGRTHYYTSGFEPEAMEERGVWRFAVRRDARLFATGRREAVLAGDERAFVITRDLGSMTVETAGSGALRLRCGPPGR